MKFRPLLWLLIPLVLVLFLFFFVSQSSAHHPEISQKADCNGYRIAAWYIGGDQKKRLEWNVVLSVNGVSTLIQGDWEGTDNGFQIFEYTGPEYDDITAIGTVNQLTKNRGQWVLEKTETFDLDWKGQCTTPTTTPTMTVTPTTTQGITPTSTLSPTPTPSGLVTPSFTSTPGPTSTPVPGPTATPVPPTPEATPKGLDKGVQYGNK